MAVGRPYPHSRRSVLSEVGLPIYGVLRSSLGRCSRWFDAVCCIFTIFAVSMCPCSRKGEANMPIVRVGDSGDQDNDVYVRDAVSPSPDTVTTAVLPPG